MQWLEDKLLKKMVCLYKTVDERMSTEHVTAAAAEAARAGRAR
jgi:hypothetical protein